MRFTESFIHEIKTRIPISRIIGTKVNFNPKKSNNLRGNYWACCPFHVEKNPSFSCNDNRGTYHCFGCQESGDVFSFLMKIEGLTFFQAVEKLANMAGLALPQHNEEEKLRQANKADIYQILEKACSFFEQLLQKDEGKEARIYLEKRNLTISTIQEFRLGYSSTHKFLLKNFLNKMNISDEQMLSAGLLARNVEDGSLYERFSGRIMFPIKDSQGRIIAFGGRSLQDRAKAKYINTAETAIFFKGKTLYNLKTAREYCYQNRKSGNYQKLDQKDVLTELIVVEGYMDVISLYQAGLKNAVAPLGTALTEEQVRLIWQSSAHPILCFDGDDAGLRAAYRTVERMMPILELDVSLRFALLPKGKDPDDIIKTEGKQLFLDRLYKAKSLIDILWQKEIENIDTSSPEKSAYTEKKILNAVQTIVQPSLRQHYAQILKARLKQFFFEARRNEVFRKKNNAPRSLAVDLEKSLQANLGIREDIVIAILLQNPTILYEKFEEIANIEFTNIQLNSIHKAMIEIVREEVGELDVEKFRNLVQQRAQNVSLGKIEERVKYIGLNTKDCGEGGKKILEQILYLYNKMHILKEELAHTEKQIRDDESFFSMLVNIKKTLKALETSFVVKD